MSDHTVRVWDMDTGECLHTLTGHTDRIGSVSLSPAGDLALSSDNRSFRLWNLATGACLPVQREEPDRFQSVRFVCDGRFVMSGSSTGTIQLWDARTGRCLHAFDTGQSEVRIAATPDGRFALSSGDDATVRLWQLDWDLAPNST